jgi:polar amino acid transport system permease protein
MPQPFDLLPPLAQGLLATLEVTLGGAALALVMGFAGGLGRRSRTRAIRWLAVAYIEVFRGTSALVQLFWVFFVLPFLGVSVSPLAAGVLVLGLNIGAYGSEVVRGALQAGQREAAIALNLNPFHRMRYVIFPQAVVAMLPPYGNLLIELLKGTALVSLVSLNELTFAAQTLRADTLRTPEIFSLVLVIYFLIAAVMTLGMRALERKLSGWRASGAPA